MTEDETIALAVTCNLGRTMTPLGRNTGEVFATDQSYRTAELFAFADAVRSAEREACAKVCEEIEDDYRKRESLRYAELRTDAQTGASDCAHRIRARGDA